MIKVSKKRRTADGRKAPAGDAQWEAFATPPVGSNLAAAVDVLNALAQAEPTLTDGVLRRALVRQLERQGMPKGKRASWLDGLIDNRLALARAGVDHMSTQAAPAVQLDTFAMAAGLGVFWGTFVARPGVPLDKLLVDVAEELGPGVGSGELRRLVVWALPRTAAFWAAGALNGLVELPRRNVSLSDHEFFAICGVIDELRAGTRR
jgi:hypothetical protein